GDVKIVRGQPVTVKYQERSKPREGPDHRRSRDKAINVLTPPLHVKLGSELNGGSNLPPGTARRGQSCLGPRKCADLDTVTRPSVNFSIAALTGSYCHRAKNGVI